MSFPREAVENKFTVPPTALVLTPLALIDKSAALVPPPRAHRHRYYGVLAPNARLRAAVTAQALGRRSASADFCGNRRRAPPSCRGPVSVGHAAGENL